MVFAGIGIGFGYVAPWAMIPDTVEYDAVKTGKRKEGAFYGMWTFTSKTGTGLVVLLSGLILSLAKYVAPAKDQVIEQAHSVLLAIRLIIGPIPAAIFIGAMLLLGRYTLDEAAYAKLKSESAGT
jgi:GPH family glycoside/pentoside/hexuronide:cation symporter